MGFLKKKKVEPLPLTVPHLGKINCPLCQNDEFYHRKILMNSEGMTFFGLEFLNESTDSYTCSKCKHMLHFNHNV